MEYWVGITDNDWYEFLAARKCPEVNFWQPSARAPFKTLPEGTPFLFKLKSPRNHIAGGGFFVRFTTMPMSVAWDAFGDVNGAPDPFEFSLRIDRLSSGRFTPDREIGCSVLTNVFYLPRERWVPANEVLSGQVVVGKKFNDQDEIGLQLWSEVTAAAMSGVREQPFLDEAPRFGRPFLASARLGQGAFRTLVMDAYKRRCAITGESTLPVLEAAHIMAYVSKGPHQVSNGLLLRSDFHKLFDLGLVTVEPDYTIRVSRKIHDHRYNGKAYYRLHGRPLEIVPDDEADRPSKDFLRWHNENRFAA